MYLIPILLVAVLTAVDQLTKYLALHFLAPVSSIAVIPGVFSLTFVLNDGAAFGLFSGARWFFVVFTIVIMGAVAYYYVKLPKTKGYRWARLSLVLIASGALGNFIDRLSRGQVVDFLNATFINFPVFNVADIYVVAGTFLLAVLMLFDKEEGESEAVETAEGGDPS